MGKILSKFSCCGCFERYKEPVIYRHRPEAQTIKTNTELEKEELETQIRYYILKHNKL
jgi:hypothetical protein